MLLAVDVGNTQTVLGLFRRAERVGDWRVSTRRGMTTDELAVLVRALLDDKGFSADEIDGMIVSTVVPDLEETYRGLGRERLGLEALFVGPGMRTGLPILYEIPQEVGADRIVNAVAALERFGAPVIVLDFGTATTFDVVSAGGEYLGGVIAPGLGISAEALFERAARLAPVDVRRPARVIGRNTQESIQSGLFHGYAALVGGVVERIRGELGADAPVVATGGLAPVFAEEMAFLAAVEPELTLDGLRLLWERNRR